MKSLSNFFGLLAILFYCAMFGIMFCEDISLPVFLTSLTLAIVCTLLFVFIGNNATDHDTFYHYEKLDNR